MAPTADRDLKIAPTGRGVCPIPVHLVLCLIGLLAGPVWAEPTATTEPAVSAESANVPVSAAVPGADVGAEHASRNAADPLFASDEVLHITLRGPLSTLARDKADEPDYRPGTLSYREADGREVSLDIGLQVRGHSRRRENVCTFPPLRVDLPKKKTLKGTLFAKQGKLKLVTFCRPTDRHQQFLLKEYLLYRMFNALTDASFRVRLLQIDYVNADRHDAVIPRWGFFIEDKKRLGNRLDLPLREPEKIDRGQVEPAHASRIEVFNYLVGNTDFSLVAAGPGRTCCHNVALYEQSDGHFLTVPYDFDMTGFVEPPYEMVSEGLGIESVRERLFRGYCWEGDYLRQAVDELLRQRPALLAIVRDDPRLEQGARERALEYLESGFEILADPDELQRRVLGECR